MRLIFVKCREEIEGYGRQAMKYASQSLENEQIHWFKWLVASPVLITYVSIHFWISVVSILYIYGDYQIYSDL